jgi:hypothetical protein
MLDAAQVNLDPTRIVSGAKDAALQPGGLASAKSRELVRVWVQRELEHCRWKHGEISFH